MAKAAKKPPTKTEIFGNIAEATGLTKKDVAAVFASLEKEVRTNLSRRGSGKFTIPGLLKIERRTVPRRPAQKKVMFGQLREIPAKPASVKVKVRALKNLKEMVAK